MITGRKMRRQDGKRKRHLEFTHETLFKLNRLIRFRQYDIVAEVESKFPRIPLLCGRKVANKQVKTGAVQSFWSSLEQQ